MKNSILKLGTMAAAVFLAGCAEHAIQELQDSKKEGREFTIALANEYLALAKKGSRIYNDFIDSRHFALKGLDAAEGKLVLPEDPMDWDLDKKDMAEFKESLKRLLFALDRGGRFVEPEVGAGAQVAFDCMLEEAEEGTARDAKDRHTCRKLFADRLGKLETVIFKNGPVRSVTFDYSDTTITHDGMLTIKEVADRVSKFKDRRIMLVGHTDPIGKMGKNRNLSMARVEGVKAALIAHGVSAHAIKISVGRGELKTSKNEVEPANRRVDIYFH